MLKPCCTKFTVVALVTCHYIQPSKDHLLKLGQWFSLSKGGTYEIIARFSPVVPLVHALSPVCPTTLASPPPCSSLAMQIQYSSLIFFNPNLCLVAQVISLCAFTASVNFPSKFTPKCSIIFLKPIQHKTPCNQSTFLTCSCGFS